MGFENLEDDENDVEESDDRVDATVSAIEEIFSDARIAELNLKFKGTEDEEDARDLIYEAQQEEARDALGAHELSPEDINDLAFELIIGNKMISIDSFVITNESGQEQEILLGQELAERLEQEGKIPELKDNREKFDPEVHTFIDNLMDIE